MSRLPASRALLALALVPILACDPGSPDADVDEFVDTADLSGGLTLSCDGAEICSGAPSNPNETYASLYRIGTTATSRGELMQTFKATQSALPLTLRLQVRSLRAYGTNGAPLLLRASIVAVTSANPLELGAEKVSGTFDLAAGVPANGTVVVPLTGSALTNGATYALVVSVDALPAGSTGTTLFGVAALSEHAYADGEALRRAQRRLDAQAQFAETRFRPAGTWDLAFALTLGDVQAPQVTALPLAGGGTETATAQVQLAPTMTDDTGVTEVRLSNDGTNFTTFAWTGSPIAWTLDPAPTGSATVHLVARDAAGNASSTFQQAFTVNLPSCKAYDQLKSYSSGTFRIKPNPEGAAFNAYCDMSTDGGGWTLFAYAGTIVGGRKSATTGSCSFYPVFDSWGTYDPNALTTKNAFSRTDLVAPLLTATAEMMARRTSVPNNLFIWPVAVPAAYTGAGGSKYLPPVSYLRLSNTGSAGLKTVTNNITVFGGPMPSYSGYNWNTPADENCDGCGRSFATALNHRSLLYWELYDYPCNRPSGGYYDAQWFHASPMTLADSTGASNTVQDVEFWIR